MIQEQSKHLEFYRNNDNDVVFWVDNRGNVGEFLFSFDKRKIYNLFIDYPHNLTKEEKTIFDKENPEWADFFADRNKQSGRLNFEP